MTWKCQVKKQEVQALGENYDSQEDYDSQLEHQEEVDDDNGDEDFFGERGKKEKEKGSSGSFKKKAIVFMMLFPAVVTGFTMVSQVFEKFNLDKTAMQVTATLGGAGIALYVMFKIPQLKDAVKFVMCFAWVIFLLPTYQVYSCSPIELKNSMIGTWFKLGTTQNDFVEKSYTTSECFNKHKLQAPYMLSALPAKISLVIQINDLINLKGQQMDEEKFEGNTYFLAISKRSVKRKFHKLYLIIEAAGSSTDTLVRSLKLSAKEKDKNLLVVTGSILNLEDELWPMKKELEKMQYLVRPIKMKVEKVTHRDRYVKFKPVDESLY